MIFTRFFCRVLRRGALLVCALHKQAGGTCGAGDETGGSFCPAVRLDPQPVAGFPAALAVCSCEREGASSEVRDARGDDDTVCIMRCDGKLFLSPLQSLQPAAEGAV